MTRTPRRSHLGAAVGALMVMAVAAPRTALADEPTSGAEPNATEGATTGEDRDPPVIRHRPLTTVAPGRPVLITATIVDASRIAFPRLYCRRVGESRFQVITLAGQGPRTFVAQIPGFALSADGLEYYLEAFDVQGNGPGLHGTPEQPHRVRVKAPSSGQTVAATPFYRRWWFWVVSTGLVAGAVTTAVLLSRRGSEMTTLEVSAPLPRPSADP